MRAAQKLYCGNRAIKRSFTEAVVPLGHEGAVCTGVEQCNGDAPMSIGAGIHESRSAVLLACAVASTRLGVYVHTRIAE